MIKKIYFHFLFSTCFGFLLVLSVSCSIETAKNRTDIPDLGVSADSLSLENACREISMSVLSRSGQTDTNALVLFYRTLDRAADSLRQVLGEKSLTIAGKNAILDVVYKNWNMAFDPRDDALETMLPHKAFFRRKGSCLGVSLMILMLAQRLDCPLHGVVLPGHFFCRFDDGESRENIEPNRSGYRHPDDYYRTKYPAAGMPWYDLKNLTKRQVVGVLYYSVGTAFLKQNDPGYAAACLKESRRLVPSLAEAQGNLALAWALCGSGDSALAIFEGLFEKYPSLKNLAANYGAVAMAAGQCEKAVDVYKKGLAQLPSDPALLLGLARASAACQKTEARK